jgi:hypothetical protein
MIMDNLINDPLVVMEFPILGGGDADRDAVVRALLERRGDIESKFMNDEFLKLDLTHQELLGIKSTTQIGNLPVGDLPALDYVIGHTEKYKGSNVINLGNVSTVYNYHS